MNQLLTRWADLSAMLLSVALSIGFTIKIVKSVPNSFKPLPLFFLIFGPMAIGVHMVAHQLFINYLVADKIFKGTFVYDFRFYSLDLMGILLAVLSFNMLRSCLHYFTGAGCSRKAWLFACAWIVLVAAPTIPFTFIGSLPVQAVVINLIASCFVRRKKSKVPVLKMHTNGVYSVRTTVSTSVNP